MAMARAMPAGAMDVMLPPEPEGGVGIGPARNSLHPQIRKKGQNGTAEAGLLQLEVSGTARCRPGTQTFIAGCGRRSASERT